MDGVSVRDGMSARDGRRFTTAVLGVGGVVALAIGLGGSLTPAGFAAGVGIDHAGDAAALSETRGAGAGVLAIGVLLLLGARRRDLAPAAALLGALAYGGYGLARLLGMALDGFPGTGLVAAAVVELVLGAVCAALCASVWSARIRPTAEPAAEPGAAASGSGALPSSAALSNRTG